MKRLLFSAVLVAFCTPAAIAQCGDSRLYDDIDSYTAGSQIVGQGGWEEWGAGAGALVSSAQSRTPGNSIDILGATDLVHQYSGYTAGKWVYRAWQFIPTGTTGQSFFIMLNDYASPAGPYSWSIQLQFDAATGQVSQQCGGTARISMPFAFDEWKEIEVVIDLDEDWVQVYYDGSLFDDVAVPNHATLGGGYSWSLGDRGTNTTGLVNIGAVDLFANGASSVYYDDISLTRLNDLYEDFDAYDTNSQVVGQGGWEEWGAGAGALVSSAQSRSSANSIDILGATDLVHQYSGYTAGKWVYRAWQFIPTGTTGQSFFIMLNDYAFPAGPYSWSIQLQFDAATGQVSQQCGGTARISMPFVFDEWAEIKVIIDLDQDWVQIYYNNVLFDDTAVPDHTILGGGYGWSLGDRGTNTTGLVNIGAVDLFANGASSVYYDDISLTLFEFETIGLGCPGSLPPAQLNCLCGPRIGQTLQVEINNLPESTAIVVLGFSHVTSAMGPLPFELSGMGAPGCWQRISVASSDLLVGTGGVVTHSVPIPNMLLLEGVNVREQCLVLDQGTNALNAVVSDAGLLRIRR